MPDLNAAERRAALLIVALLLLGAGRDAWRATHPRFVAPRPFVSGGTSVSNPGQDPATPVRNPAPRPAAPAAEIVPVDLNRAGPAELDALPGVGPVLAARILDHRKQHGPFQSADELMAVRGIGPRLFARIRPYVVVPQAAGGH